VEGIPKRVKRAPKKAAVTSTAASTNVAEARIAAPKRHAPGDGVDAQPSRSADRPMSSKKPGKGALQLIELRAALRGAQPPESEPARKALSKGTPTPLGLIVGVPIGIEGLKRVYAAALPGCDVDIFDFQVKAKPVPHIRMQLEWIAQDGSVAAKASRAFRICDDGALDVHGFNAFTKPEFRGHAQSARLAQQELKLVRALSAHDGSRLSCRAGYATNPDSNEKERVGCYAWAALGYDFAAEEEKAGGSPVNYAPRLQGAEVEDVDATDRELLQKAFGAFLDDAAKQHPIFNDPDARQALEDIAAAWKHPYEIATTDIGLNVEVKVGDRTTSCPIGKAYLLSPQAPAWYGSVRANGAREETKLAESLWAAAIEKAEVRA
jgi:hypothetical protein